MNLSGEVIGYLLIGISATLVAAYNMFIKFQTNIEKRIADSRMVTDSIIRVTDQRYVMKEAVDELRRSIERTAQDLAHNAKEEAKSSAESYVSAVSSQVQSLREEFREFKDETKRAGEKTSITLGNLAQSVTELAAAVREHIKAEGK